MTAETLKKANEITQEIERMNACKADVSGEHYLKKNTRQLPQDVIDAGKSAMLAVLDEAIDNLQAQLDKL